MLARSEFQFSHLQPDAPDLHGDLAWLLRFVARTFEVRVGEIVVFDEVEFPVLDLARALGSWLTAGFIAERRFTYELPGGAPDALAINPSPEGWAVGSMHRVAGGPTPVPVGGGEICASFRAFVDDIAAETWCAYGYDVYGLLGRMASGPSDGAPRDRQQPRPPG